MKKKILLLVSVLLLLIVNSVYAVNYLFGDDSVDGGEIRWGGSTKYSTQWNNAISVWNNAGDIDILPDIVSTYEDVTVVDVYEPNEDWSGYMNVGSIGSDELELNKYYLDRKSWTARNKQHTISHELGHALGLAHHNLSLNMLQSGKRSTITLGTQDKKDYDYLWK